MPFISIVIPAYNEAERLPPTLDRILDYFNKTDFKDAEILVVDDGSRDGTPAIAEAYADRHRSIRVLQNDGNHGKGYSVRRGMLEAEGEWILFTDADLSSPIEEMPKLLRAAEESGAAVALGSRALDRRLVEIHQPLAREIAGRLFNLLLRATVLLPFHDTQCGFKLFRRDAAREIFARQLLDGFSFDVEDLVIARRLGYRAVEVPVRWKNVDGTTVTLGHGMKSFADLITIRANDLRGRYSRPVCRTADRTRD